MQTFNWPLSGDVSQAIKAFSDNVWSMGGQFGFININNTETKAPEVEIRVIQEAGSYGRQLGLIGDVMAILMKRLDAENDLAIRQEAIGKEGKPADLPAARRLTDEEKLALARLAVMLDHINTIKEECGRKTLRFDRERTSEDHAARP